jgi:hypothetical protein
MTAWKLVPLLLLASCATPEPVVDEFGTVKPGNFTITSSVNIPLAADQASTSEGKVFRLGDSRVELQPSGAWSVRNSVVHSRLRCANYETGVQAGKGDAACSSVEWFTPVEYVSRRSQCNSAPLVHTGEGQFKGMKPLFTDTNCVRVVVRCEGNC